MEQSVTNNFYSNPAGNPPDFGLDLSKKLPAGFRRGTRRKKNSAVYTKSTFDTLVKNKIKIIKKNSNKQITEGSNNI
jgi:hypothetical protein